MAIAANRFYLVYEKTRLRPTLTVSIDPQVIFARGADILRNCASPYLVPQTARYLLPEDIRSQATAFRMVRNATRSRFSSDPQRGLGDAGSVVFTALQLAVWMRPQRIVLYGVDHDFGDDRSRDSGGPVADPRGFHFAPNYRDRNELWWPPDTQRIEHGFRLARHWSRRNSLPIVNATRGGKLDIFDRTDFDIEARVSG